MSTKLTEQNRLIIRTVGHHSEVQVRNVSLLLTRARFGRFASSLISLIRYQIIEKCPRIRHALCGSLYDPLSIGALDGSEEMLKCLLDEF